MNVKTSCSYICMFISEVVSKIENGEFHPQADNAYNINPFPPAMDYNTLITWIGTGLDCYYDVSAILVVQLSTGPGLTDFRLS